MAAELDQILKNEWSVEGDLLNPLAGLALVVDGREGVGTANCRVESRQVSTALRPVPDGPVLLVNNGALAIRVRVLQTDDMQEAAECLTQYRWLSDMVEHEIAPRQALTIPGAAAFVVVQIVTDGAVMIRPVGMVPRGPASLTLTTYIIQEA